MGMSPRTQAPGASPLSWTSLGTLRPPHMFLVPAFATSPGLSRLYMLQNGVRTVCSPGAALPVSGTTQAFIFKTGTYRIYVPRCYPSPVLSPRHCGKCPKHLS